VIIRVNISGKNRLGVTGSWFVLILMDNFTSTACLETTWYLILDTTLDTPVEHVVVIVTLLCENIMEELAGRLKLAPLLTICLMYAAQLLTGISWPLVNAPFNGICCTVSPFDCAPA
jgi:hypothetical protein